MRTGKNWKCCDKYDGTLDIVKMPKGIHESKSICKYCGHFIKWNPSSKVDKEKEERNKDIDYVITKYEDELPKKQLDFIKNMKEKRFLTPAQFKYLNDIIANYRAT